MTLFEDHVRAYLDINVVSTIARDDIPQESAAVDKLLRALEKANVELLTSRATKAVPRMRQAA